MTGAVEVEVEWRSGSTRRAPSAASPRRSSTRPASPAPSAATSHEVPTTATSSPRSWTGWASSRGTSPAPRRRRRPASTSAGRRAPRRLARRDGRAPAHDPAADHHPRRRHHRRRADQETLADVVPTRDPARVTAMARVVVVGGGYGGLASAARLAKLGHDVTVLEARDTLGGALGTIERDGFTWDAGPTTRCCRPCRATCSASPAGPWSASSSWCRSPRCASTGSRTAPSSTSPAVSRATSSPRSTRRSGPGSARAWVEHVDAFADDWAALRRDYFERPFSARAREQARPGPARHPD